MSDRASIGAGGELVAWQRAMELVVEVFRLSDRLPPKGRAILANQMRRAAASIPANIAEGNARAHRREYLQFLGIARGSLAELATHLEIARRTGFLTDADLAVARHLTQEVRRLLSGLVSSLSRPHAQ